MNAPQTILLVDDDRDFVAAISRLLEGAGYRVHSAPDSRAGLAALQAVQPDLVLLDVMMTERTEGFFLLQTIRETPALAGLPVIVVSSIYAEVPAFRVSPTAGWLPADLFLAKPVDPARLLASIARLLDVHAHGAADRSVAS